MSFEEIKMEEDESFDEFYAKLKDIVNLAFNLGETIPKPKIRKIQKQCVFMYIGTCVSWMAVETKFSKLCIFCSLDEHLNAQLNK